MLPFCLSIMQFFCTEFAILCSFITDLPISAYAAIVLTAAWKLFLFILFGVIILVWNTVVCTSIELINTFVS